MNRDHVGMIFKFLPKEEQEELRNLKPEEREFHNRSCRGLQWEEDRDYMKFDDSNAYRPKGFLSWNEIIEKLETYKGKVISSIDYKFECPFKWDGKDIFKYGNGTATIHGSFVSGGTGHQYLHLDRPDLGFKVLEDK